MPQVSGSGCSSRLSKKQTVDWESTPTKTGSPAWKISSSIADTREVVLLVDSCSSSDGAMNDVVDGPQGHLMIVEVAPQFDHAPE
jgi:hypothetical protein